MSQTFKLNHVEGDNIKNIYIFSTDDSIKSPEYNDSNGNPVFSTKEQQHIMDKNIPVEIISTTTLHGDDTIGMVKKKIVHALELEISTKEMYLFGITKTKLNSSTLYKQLTQQETIPLTQEILCTMLLNIVENGCDDNEVETTCKEIAKRGENISYDDFLHLLDWGSEHSYTIPIGERLIGNGKLIPYVVNPYNCISINNFIKENIPGIVTTQNKNLLFEAGNLCLNNIFFCLAEEVLEYTNTHTKMTDQNILSLYFPLLVSIDKITSLSILNDKKRLLMDTEYELLDKAFIKYNEQVDLFYDIYKHGNSTNPLDYLYDTPGITAISIIIHPVYEIKFPLEILFKLIHSTRNIPLIKYNPGSKKENIYRLFTANNIATNGKKIPFLYTYNNNKKTLIIKLSKILAHTKRVSFLINVTFSEIKYDITCSISDTGTVYINLPSLQNSIKPLSLQQIEDIIQRAVKEPILDKIKTYLEQSGYTYIPLTTIADKNVEIENITWVSKLQIPNKIDLNKYISCFSTIFAIEKGSLKKTSEVISMRYKRVSAYNQMSAEDAFITELRKQNVPHSAIVEQLQTNFKLSKQASELKIASWASEVQQRADLFDNKKERTIITNVGFPVIITRDATNNTVTVTINTINNIHYLKYIHIYIDSMLRLFVNKKSIGISSAALKLLCKGKAIKMKGIEEDVAANDDKDFLNKQFEAEQSEAAKITFEDDDVDDFLDDLLGDDDDTEDEDEKEEEEDDALQMDEISFGDEITFGDETPSPIKDKTPSPIQEQHVIADTKLADSSPQSGSELSEAEIDLTGLPLRGAKSIFMQNNTMKRGLMWRDPTLFIKQGKGRYSTACPSQYDKQPIVLTSKEKDYIDKKDASFGINSYDESITYGTGKDKFHYVCPRFWCLNDENGKQRSITLKEINEGKCGGWDALIPRKAKKIPPGGRIYEFTDQRFHRERYQMDDTDNILVYKPMYPGFQEKTKHPDNLCIPCCFGRPRGLSQKAIDKGWTVEEKDKKLYFKNKEGDIVNKNIVPRQLYDGTNNTDYMYKPTGSGKEGTGPTFERDEKGNIKLETIKGTPQLRELPAGSRMATIKDCNEDDEGDEDDEDDTGDNITLKMEEAPAWEVFPLKTGQLGYLPEAVQKFFQYNQRPVKGDSSLRLKINKPVFLRKGMERSKTQSFLSCIADIYNYYALSSEERNKTINLQHTTEESIQWIKDIILQHLQLDNFVTFQNGTLVDLFYKDNDMSFRDREVEIYQDDLLYIKLSETNPTYLLKIISALNNFKAYLSDDKVEINYEYIWDIICMPQTGKNNELGGIFSKGLNLLILKSPDDDITNKIEVICPTNFYGTGYFDNDREILILYTRDGYYEPIYKYTRVDEGNAYKINKLLFIPRIEAQAPQLAQMIKYVRTKLLENCKPLPSNTNYKFKENIPLVQLLQAIQKCKKITNYKVAAQILNLNTKVIGIIIKKGKNKGFMIPCRPSELHSDIPFILADDPDILNSFETTLQNLQNMCVKSKCNIYCKPILKIVNNNVIVGIITETNQFIPVIPEPHDKSHIDDDGVDENGLIVIESNNGVENYLTQPALNNNTVDEERIRSVNNIKLESQLYNSFRNILRIIINQIENKIDIKNHLIEILNNVTTPYYTKLRNIIELLHSIMDDYVAFTDYKISSKLAVKSILKCINLDEGKCSDAPTCLFVKENGKCKLQIPRKNLISETPNNEEIYFGRLADELIRYSRIRMFILNPRQFLSFQQMTYNLKEDEIILLEDILYGDYFEDIIPQYINPFIASKNIFDIVEPSVSIPYKDTFILDTMLNTKSVNECLITKKSDKKLKLEAYLRARKLSPDFTLLEFKHNFMCTWELAIFILNDYGINITIKDLQELLQQTYSSYNRSEKMPTVIELWQKEGKQPLIGALTNDLIGTINLEDYYLTPLDYFIIFNNYECPCIITSRTKICLYAHLNLAFYKESNIQNVYVIFGGAWNTKRTDNIKLPIYGILQRNGSIRLPIAYFGSFGERLIQNPVTTFEQYNTYMSKVQQIKLKGLKIKKKSGVKKLGKIRLRKK